MKIGLTFTKIKSLKQQQQSLHKKTTVEPDMPAARHTIGNLKFLVQLNLYLKTGSVNFTAMFRLKKNKNNISLVFILTIQSEYKIEIIIVGYNSTI
ncbi:hypothetical protein BLOT_008103 [Blomia tropicalis]|nr:hypothetical protein BLOT_008103 [Blomia tropicalis]